MSSAQGLCWCIMIYTLLLKTEDICLQKHDVLMIRLIMSNSSCPSLGIPYRVRLELHGA